MKNSNPVTPKPAQQPNFPTPQERHQLVDRSRRMMIQHISAFDRIDTPMPISEIQDVIAYTCSKQVNHPTLDQEQMQALGETISERVRCGECYCSEINLSDFTLKYGKDTFYFGDTIFSFTVLGGDEGVILSLHESCRTNTSVLIGDCNGVTRAFLGAEWEDGQYRIVELSDFYFLSTFTVKWENFGLSTMFNRKFGIMDFGVLATSLRQKYPLRTDIPASTKAPRNRGDHRLLHDEEY